MDEVRRERIIAALSALSAPRLEAELFDATDVALLAYAEKLTVSPGRVTERDVESLRSVGLDDRGIHDACAIVAYYAFVNRIADGLGVELES